ncbi:hypothetical protein AB870_13255 [Pandoraea faecigallinarum]|uniref:Uncharacterized protein n=1 Tax=Pandoraea faecigallinarum TaxID=656179 RepID=A0A0H3WRN5_9BURK|nr:hypothetical protein [Pandoraea faecigallinarum]AKM30864.1 hypothetical protein AB870_13255 [Pandoraea faecigallinarum]
MALTAHPLAHRAPACYGAPHGAPRKRRAAGFAGAFRGARSECASLRAARCSSPARRHGRHVERGERGNGIWPAALAVMLVANFAAGATASLPRRPRDPSVVPEGAGAVHRFDGEAHLPPPAIVPDTVIVEPVQTSGIKTDYDVVDALRALAAARAPFTSAGESMTDAYTLMTGQEVSPETRRTMRGWTSAVDITTGLIPEVQLLRLPAEISEATVDGLEGKRPSIDRLIDLVQFGSPRGGAISARPREATAASAVAAAPDVIRQADSRQAWAPRRTPDDQSVRFAGVPDNLSERRAPTSRFAIQGEFDHLDGYEQTFSEAELPTREATRLVIVNGRHYLRGEAGYYRATPGMSADHWLVDAPRRNRAQVPVTYDPSTDRWQAHEPLRLCGGGCGSSRPLTPDSIAGSFEDIFAATRHLPDESAQEAIQNSFADLARLHLIRSNRPDLRTMRDNSIIDHRVSLRTLMKDIDRQSPLVKQQRQAAEVTARYYYDHPFAEAFCQENAEILFRFLLQDGIDVSQLRMITVQPKNRPPHVMVLYTESPLFIEMLDISTPQPRLSLHQDGVSSAQFAWAVYMTRDTTLLLDPWSRNKAISFARADGPHDVVDILDAALSDIGHRSGYPYTVSVTRPLAGRRGTLSSQTSLGSVASTASSGGTSGGASGTSDPSALSLPAFYAKPAPDSVVALSGNPAASAPGRRHTPPMAPPEPEN